MTFEQALKATRRGIFVHGDKYRTAIIGPRAVVATNAFIEAKAIIDGSSLRLEKVNVVTRTIYTEKGGIIRFFGLSDYMDTLAVKGFSFPNVIMIGEKSDYNEDVLAAVGAINRSPYEEVPVSLCWVEGL